MCFRKKYSAFTVWDGSQEGCYKQMCWKASVIVQSIEEDGLTQEGDSRDGEEVMDERSKMLKVT